MVNLLLSITILFIIPIKAMESDQNISRTHFLGQIPKEILKNEILKKNLLNKTIENIKSAKNLSELYQAIKDLRNFSLTSKTNLKIFKELFEEKLIELNGKSLKEFFILNKIKKKLEKDFPTKNFDWFNDINALNEYGWTALIFASLRNNKEIVELLIQNGADVNMQDYYAGWTALMWAALKGNEEIAQLLIQNQANINLKNKENIGGWSYPANDNTLEEIAELVYQTRFNGSTALQIAIQTNNTEIIELLISNGAISSSLYYKLKQVLDLIKSYNPEEEIKDDKEEVKFVGRHECTIQ